MGSINRGHVSPPLHPASILRRDLHNEGSLTAPAASTYPGPTVAPTSATSASASTSNSVTDATSSPSRAPTMMALGHGGITPESNGRAAETSSSLKGKDKAFASSSSSSLSSSNARRRRWQDQCRVVRLIDDADAQPEAFEMLIVGCGGGPLETNLSSYLVKPYATKWADGCTSLEGGSTIGALAHLIETQPHAFADFGLKIGVDLHEQSASGSGISSSSRRDDLAAHPAKRTRREEGSPARRSVPVGVGRGGGGKAAGKVWDMVRCFAVSHAHLDHIQGLVISSGASMSPRPLYGTLRTLANLDNVFDGGVWPKLVGWESDGKTVGRAYLYRELPTTSGEWSHLSSSLSVEALPLSHGMDPSCFHPSKPKVVPASPLADGSPHTPPAESYDSTAFFIRESLSGHDQEFLFFGDVEPDSISKRPLNLAVWRVAAPRILAKRLSTIFLECSYPTSQPIDKLWGHLSPPFVIEELLVLRDQVVQSRVSEGWSPEDAELEPLKGVTVVIIHIKDDILSFPSASPSPTPSPPPETSADYARKPVPSPRLLTAHLSVAHSPLSMSPPLPAMPSQHRHSVVGGLGGYSLGKGSPLDPFAPSWASTDSSSNLLASRRASLPASLSNFGAFAGRRKSATSLLAAKDAISSVVTPPEFLLGPPSEHLVEGEGTGGVDFGDEDESVGMEDETVHERIERELNELERKMRTGVRFLRATQGMRIGQSA